MIARRDFLTGLGGLALTPRFLQSGRSSRPQYMYVGSFTSQARGHGEGLTVFRKSEATSPWTRVQLLKDLENPSFLTIDRPGQFLYSVHSDGDRVSAYRIDAATGKLTLINHQDTKGRNGVHLSLDATGRFLIVANYDTGTLAVLPINKDGSLAAVCDLATLSGTPGPHKTEQPGPHPHDCPFDPGRAFIVVPDKGLDRIFVFKLDTAAGKLVPADPPSVATRSGAGPRHVDFHPTRPFAYVVNELSSSVSTYAFNPRTGSLQPIQILPSTPSSFTGNNTGAEIAVSKSGRFVYVSNRGHNSIGVFAINGTDGTLSPVAWESTQGGTPRYFGIDPSGTHLYAANQTTDTVVVFRIDEASGKLTPTGEILKVGAPCTIGWIA